MDQLGPNALGETLEPGRVTDCYLGLLLPPGSAGELEACTVLVVAPAVMTLLGHRAWILPGALDRVLPRISLEGEREEAAPPPRCCTPLFRSPPAA